MNKTITLAAVPLLIASSLSQADTLGFTIGANVWQQSFSGSVLSSTDTANTIDLEDDLAYDDENGNNFYIAFEHPIPIIPNIRLAQTEIEVGQATNFNRDIAFEGVSYSVNEPITSTSDLSHTDATLYYEVLDNWISLDVGLTARIFSEGFEVTGASSGNSDFDLDETIPMLYAGVKFELPVTGLYVGGHGNFIAFDSNTMTDITINLGYETSFGLGVEAGFRSFDIDYEEDSDNEAADITIDGSYIGLFYHF